MKLATRATRIAPSPTLNMAASVKRMVAQGEKIIDFSAGEPAFETPEFIRDAAIAAIREGFTHYTPVTGIDELKEAILDKCLADHGLRYEKSQVLVSCGAKHALYNLAQVLLEEGDEVILPTPYWVSYPDQIALAGARTVLLPTEEVHEYAIDPEALEARITPRTKAIILNSPGNPTGAVYSRRILEEIATLALRYNLLIVSDEIYERMVYDKREHVSIASLAPEVQARTVLVNGVSKTYAMTGWRIGYAVGPTDLIAAMGHLQSQSTSNPTSIAQKAAVAALRGDQSVVQEMVRALDDRRQCMVKRLQAIPGVQCPVPGGAFYAFPNISELIGRRHANGTIANPSDLVAYLLSKAGIACVPGEPFGSTSHIRLSYTPDVPCIEEGMDRFEAAVKALMEA
ncbi:MAG: pyridoxal phosphate-dependent aminotransferase [Nitrospirae bacterium]|nr:MAG: pyridoxal phosphate-dependent aminotransferase [Nitrospirota bacterium]